MTQARLYTLDTLAERWGCSCEQVRQLCKRGGPKHFRLGKLYRIPAQAVEAFEGCQDAEGNRCDKAFG